MQIQSESYDALMILRPEGRLDAVTAPGFDRETANLLQQQPGCNFLINFGKIEYISSVGLRSLLVLAKLMQRQERKLALCGLGETISEVFRISGFDSLLPVLGTEEDGLAYLKGV